MDEVKEFLEWERLSRDTIDVKRCYIDICGDVVTGLMLSQIIYWNLPGTGDSKLCVERDGKIWLAKKRKDWWEECRISVKQVDRSLKILKDLGLIEVRLYQFSGLPTQHIWLNVSALLEGVKRILPKGQSGYYRKGKVGITERVKPFPITKTTNIDYPTETTPKIPRKGPGKPSEKDGIVSAMFTEMRAYLGYPERVPQDPIPNYGQEGIAIKRLLTRGYSSEEILKYWRERVDKAGGFVTMVYVNQDIGRPVPGKPGGNHRRQGDIPSGDELSRKAHQLGLPE